LALTFVALRLQEGKDKKGKKDAPAAASMDVVSVDELNQKIATLEKEKNKEEEYRNYMQLERVSIFLDVARLMHAVTRTLWRTVLACVWQCCMPRAAEL